MILLKMLPGVLKELVKHVPTVLFKVVDWNELMAELPKLSRRLLQKEGYEELFHKQQNLLLPFSIKVTDQNLKRTTHELTHTSGELLLHLYFAQLFSPDGLFLDLRTQHFHLEDQELSWHPSGLWVKFEEKFRQGLLEVYEGFYLQNEEKYRHGLKCIGLLQESWSAEDKEQLAQLFKGQFGEALTSAMSFDLSHFQTSILKMSEFMLSKEVNISKDFLYLGIYLVTLYDHLDNSELKYPVRDIYLEVRNRFQGADGPP